MSTSRNYKNSCRVTGYVVFDYDALFPFIAGTGHRYASVWAVDLFKRLQFHLFVSVLSFRYVREYVVSGLLDAGIKKIPLVMTNDNFAETKEYFFKKTVGKLKDKFQKEPEFLVIREYGSYCGDFNVLQLLDKR